MQVFGRIGFLTVFSLFSVAPAWAENMAIAPRIYVQIKVRGDGTIRAESQINRNDLPQNAYTYAIFAVAIKAKALGFSRFAVVKATGGTMMMSGIAISHQARVVAKPLNADEPSPEGMQGPLLTVEQVLNAELPTKEY